MKVHNPENPFDPPSNHLHPSRSRFVKGETSVSFPLKSAIQRKTEDNNVPVNGNGAKNVVENVAEKLNDRQNRILEAIRNNPAVSACILSKSLGFNHRTIQRDLKHMQKLGIIVHQGPDKGGTWEINVIE